MSVFFPFDASASVVVAHFFPTEVSPPYFPSTTHSATLRRKEIETKSILVWKANKILKQITAEKEKLSSIMIEAEKAVPKKEWGERLAARDLPVDLEAVNKALKELMSIVESMEARRKGEKRVAVIDAMAAGLKKLFKSVNVAPMEKKRKSDELSNHQIPMKKRKP